MTTITLRAVKGLIQQAKAAGCDTSTGCWLVQRCSHLHDVILTNGTVTFSSAHNAKEFQNENVSSVNTMSTMANVTKPH